MKKSLEKNVNKCDRCTGKCCRYILVDLPTPKSRLDFDNYGWYLAHQDMAIYIDDGIWYLTVFNKCRYLGDDNRCQNYDNRYRACREHSNDNCEFDGDKVADVVFRNPDELQKYADKRFRAIARKRKASAKKRLVLKK